MLCQQPQQGARWHDRQLGGRAHDVLPGDSEVPVRQVQLDRRGMLCWAAPAREGAAVLEAGCGAQLGDRGLVDEREYLGSGHARADFGVGSEPLDHLRGPRLEVAGLAAAGVEIDPDQRPAVAEGAEHDADAAALPVDHLRRVSLGRGPRAPGCRIIGLGPPAVRRIGNLGHLAAARLRPPPHPARRTGKGVERGHNDSQRTGLLSPLSPARSSRVGQAIQRCRPPRPTVDIGRACRHTHRGCCARPPCPFAGLILPGR